MTPVAIGGLLFAASLHAAWNFLLKTSTDKQAYTVLALGAASLFLLPVALLRNWTVSLVGWRLIGLSALCEVIYFLLLGSAYTGGQLSLIYPISRGLTLLFTTLIAVVLIGERVSALGLLGIALVVVGIYVLHLRSFHREGLLEPFGALRGRPSQLAPLSGLAVAGYSTVDKVVSHMWITSVYVPSLRLDDGVAGAIFAAAQVRCRASRMAQQPAFDLGSGLLDRR